MKKRNASMCFHIQKAEFEKTPIFAPPSTGIVIECRTESHMTKSHSYNFAFWQNIIGQKSHNIKFGIGAYD
jgi:hypothetical protein